MVVFHGNILNLIYFKILCSAFESLSMATFLIWFKSKSYAVHLIESSHGNILNLIYIKILCSAFDESFHITKFQFD